MKQTEKQQQKPPPQKNFKQTEPKTKKTLDI